LARQRKFRALPEVTDDIRAIHRRSEKLAVLIIEKLADLKAGRIEGQPLAELAGTGDLSDCRKIYVGLDPIRPTHRIVYRRRDDGVVEVIEVVAVGEREALAVYLEALKRLGRPEQP
jgi:mRNA interferase RelE/StbE